MLRQSHKRAAGFTLLEMIVTMAIFAILVAAGIPIMRTWIANAKVRAVADALQNGVRLAQAESLRRSRQVVFSLTNSSSPQTSLTAAANGNYWAINTVAFMTDGSDPAVLVESGVLSSNGTTVQINGPAEICFNSLGRLITNASTGVAGGSCALPTTNPAVWAYNITMPPTADHPLQVQVNLGGQVHMCDPSRTLSLTNPDGC
jgi:type IV fimbrial biogenesis protein FimT